LKSVTFHNNGGFGYTGACWKTQDTLFKLVTYRLTFFYR